MMNDQTPAPLKGRTAHESPLGWLRTEIDRLFDDFGRPARSIFQFANGALSPAPALEMTENDIEYRLTAELPGMTESDVEISLAEGMLTLSGEKREEDERKESGFMLSERRYGAFERRVALPADVDTDAITAEFKKGVLTIKLPKDDEAPSRTRKIAISAAS